jgi:hypothetical protein
MTPEKIGAFDTSDFRVDLNLLPQAFSEVWAAAVATTGAERFIRFDFKENHPGILTVTEASLSEFMSSPIVHPVVAELHIMRDTLKGAVLTLTATALLVLRSAPALSIA